MGHDPSIALPHVGGHELAGEVVAVGAEVRGFAEGDRVTVPFCCGCGSCATCRQGETQLCERDWQPGFSLWGSFAEFVALPRADLNLVRLPEALTDVEAASLGCRFMTAWAALHVHAEVRAGEWVAVHGCGGVGAAAVMIAAAAGARVIAVDIDPAKLERARELGAEHAVAERPLAAIRELTGGGAHVSLDALGSTETCDNSIRCLRRRGRHVQVGLLPAELGRPALPWERIIGYELAVLGSHGLAAHAYPELLGLVTAGVLRPDLLVTETIALDAAPAALVAMGGPGRGGIQLIEP
jgi:alcohol dehydrogenase